MGDFAAQEINLTSSLSSWHVFRSVVGSCSLFINQNTDFVRPPMNLELALSRPLQSNRLGGPSFLFRLSHVYHSSQDVYSVSHRVHLHQVELRGSGDQAASIRRIRHLWVWGSFVYFRSLPLTLPTTSDLVLQNKLSKYRGLTNCRKKFRGKNIFYF